MPDPDTTDGSVAPTTSDGDVLFVVAAALATVVAALWLAVIWLPYASFGQVSLSLWSDGGPPALRPANVAPRLLGSGLVVVLGVVTLAGRRIRAGAWCATGGALLGLAAFAANQVASSWETAPRAGHGSAWYLDAVLCASALVAVAIGAMATVRADGGRRPTTTPYVALAAAGLGVATLVLTTRSHVFLPSLATSTDLLFESGIPLSMRLVPAPCAVVMVALPVLAALARARQITIGLAIGWVAFVAVPATAVVAVRNLVPGGVGVAFVVGALLVVGGAAALVAWAVGADRTEDPLARTRAERRDRTEPSVGLPG